MIGTLAGLRTYADARGISGPTDAVDADATAALVRASDYITHAYVRWFMDGFDETSDYVEEATYEAAILELATPRFFSKTHTPGKKELTQVEGIKWTTAENTSKHHKEYRPVSTKIDDMLEGYLRRNYVSGFMVT